MIAGNQLQIYLILIFTDKQILKWKHLADKF